MNESIDLSVSSNNSELLISTIANIIQIPIIILISILTFAYIAFILTHKTFRSNKLSWPTINVFLATGVFSLAQLMFAIIHMTNVTNTMLPCRLQGFIVYMSACQMMYSYCVSSFNRLLAIRYFAKPLFRSQRWLLSSISIGWIVGVLAAFPYLFYDSFACQSSDDGEFLKSYSCIVTLVIPVIIVAVCNISIFWYVRQSSRRVHNFNNNRNNSISRKRDLHLSKIMVLTFSVFVMGWTPIFFEKLFTNDERRLPISVSSFFQILLPASLLGDMILLIYSNQPIRMLIKKTLKPNRLIPFVIQR